MLRICLYSVLLFLLSCSHPSDLALNQNHTPNKEPQRTVAQNLFLGRQKIQPTYSPNLNSKKIKVAFFDADSTLRVALSGSVTANTPTDVMTLPFIETQLKCLAEAGYFIAIVSNQGGIAQGYISLQDSEAALDFTVRKIFDAGGIVHYFDFAEGNDEFRKPGHGMALRLEANLKKLFGPKVEIDYKKSFMVGDSAYKQKIDLRPGGAPGTHFSNADRLFAEGLKIPFYEPTDFFGWREGGIDVFVRPTQVTEYLSRTQPVLTCRMDLFKIK
jgi:DNA 3'-phosphatase